MADQPRHGELREVLPGVFFVTGEIKMAGPIRFSRNMVVVREGAELVIVNSIRLDDAGLAALDKLGKVTHVLRLAGFHGRDDAFYNARYGARVSTVKGQIYARGFKQNPADVYFRADAELDASSPLPITGARLHVIHSAPPEGILLLDVAGGTLISGDALQNWARPDEYFSWVGKTMMRMMGFIKPHNVGPGWLKQAKPPAAEVAALSELAFANVLPAHGEPVLGNARALYQPSIAKAAKLRSTS
ncbi:MAG: hypothetical protein ACKV2T_22175 [Kofleriaceae bacterium]